MLHRVMIKTTPLTDVVGRVDYISSPDRQEHLVYADENCADTEFWKRLSEHCQAMAPGKKACEGREFILPLPNWMYEEMYADDVAERFQRIVDAKTGTKSAVAIHWNRKGNSYHMHIVCSENEELPEPEPVKVREPLKRDTYFNAAGKRSPKKECVDAETKQLLPGCSVIRKGQTQPDQLEVRRFSNKNRKISSREFLNELKQDFANELNDLMYEYGHDNDYFVVADGILSSLKKRLVNEHDGLTVDSLRSLGKTNREIAKELQWIEMNNIPFFVLDLPSTFNDKAKPIEVLSETYTKLAEFEVQKIREGQAKSNKPLGRSRIPYPPNWDFVYNKWLNKEITIPEFMKLTGLKRGTLYNLLKQSKRQESEANSLKNSNNHSA